MTDEAKRESGSGLDPKLEAEIQAEEIEAEELEEFERGQNTSYGGFFPGESNLHEMGGL
ncbi:hypothetical protein EV379_1617 [Microterricola gilva]|uniref:Uncharacterized protein n=1 Tax=Microterricola gilva TaxID=393267 RepID=A0A4Q8AMX4_9MICO|nr:hypothetical protein [Microterricola gilva]RZU65289.1 hypothetical protein EV379_1617 [Microterricola gilva]